MGAQSSHFLKNSKSNNSKPEVEIHFVPTAFFIVPQGPKSATYSVRTTALQVGDFAKVPRPQKFWPQFSRNPIERPMLKFITLLSTLGPLTACKAGRRQLRPKKCQCQKGDFFGFGGLTPKLKIWAPTATGGLVGPLVGHLSPQTFRRYPQPFSRKLGWNFAKVTFLTSLKTPCSKWGPLTVVMIDDLCRGQNPLWTCEIREKSIGQFFHNLGSKLPLFKR